MIKIYLDMELESAWIDIDRLVTAALGQRPVRTSIREEANFLFYLLDNSTVVLFDNIKKKEIFSSSEENKKRQVLRFLVESFKNNYHVDLPWGILTGIRPMKLYRQLRQEMRKVECHQRLTTSFLLAKEKLNLLSDVYEKQESILSEIDLTDSLALYIGIPYCPSKCSYCTFLGYPCNDKNEINKFFQALISELKMTLELIDASKYRLISIYVGGGTPASLEVDQIKTLLNLLNSKENKIELNFEAGRADCLNKDKVKAIYEGGVTRLSINPQTFREQSLKEVNRKHSVQEFIDIYKLAREIGFDSINCDLIFGLPGEDKSDMKKSLEELGKLRPDSITIHSLAVKTKSKMREELLLEDFHRSNLIGEMIDFSGVWAKERDYSPYYMYRQKNIAGNQENIAYSQTGKESLYNILIMEELVPIIGLGCGAVSKLIDDQGKFVRLANPADPDYYVSNIKDIIENKGNKVAKLLTK